MSAIGQMLLGSGGKLPAEITHIQSRRTGANTNTSTITQSLNLGPSTISIGTASNSRHIILAFQGGTNTATGISACTITPTGESAINMTNLVNIGTSGDGFISIWIAKVPVGTTATFSATVSGLCNYAGWHVYEIQNLESMTAHDTYTDNAGGTSATLTATLDTVEDGVILGVYNAYKSFAAPTVVWSGTSGITEDFDDPAAGTGISCTAASANTASGTVNATAICNPDGTTTSSEKIAVVTLR